MDDTVFAEFFDVDREEVGEGGYRLEPLLRTSDEAEVVTFLQGQTDLSAITVTTWDGDPYQEDHVSIIAGPEDAEDWLLTAKNK